MDSKLNEHEITFCELYINGSSMYAGNASKCYADVFKSKSSECRTAALRLLNEPRIQKYIEELESLNAFDAKRKREYIARHLENIIEETSKSEYRDSKGMLLSPAALRSVSVQAMKLYADLYPVKEAQVNKINIEGSGNGGVTFNLIIPSTEKNEQKSETE